MDEYPEIIVYHAEGCRSERLIWFLEELEIPYKVETIK